MRKWTRRYCRGGRHDKGNQFFGDQLLTRIVSEQSTGQKLTGLVETSAEEGPTRSSIRGGLTLTWICLSGSGSSVSIRSCSPRPLHLHALHYTTLAQWTSLQRTPPCHLASRKCTVQAQGEIVIQPPLSLGNHNRSSFLVALKRCFKFNCVGHCILCILYSSQKCNNILSTIF